MLQCLPPEILFCTVVTLTNYCSLSDFTFKVRGSNVLNEDQIINETRK
jgi:hypothetical protein